MKYKLFYVLVIISISGCADTGALLHDERFKTGCVVVTGQYNGTFAIGSVAACEVLCSETLPDNYKYSYTNGSCDVQIGH